MTKKLMKSKSSRQSCRQKYKIQRKVREHNKKVRKNEKKKKFHKRPKDPGVPNSLPFKSEILADALQYKANLAEEKRIELERRKAAKKEKKMSLEGIVKSADKRGKKYDSNKEATGESTVYNNSRNTDLSAKAYYRDFCKVVASSDVILQVLDARDPIGTRCLQVEESVLAHTNKRLVLILNKIDLVPRVVVSQWVNYLRKSFPTIAVKCSTLDQKDRIGRTGIPIEHLDNKGLKSSKSLGANDLMKLLGNYCRNNGVKTSISVGVVGLPNTGKSSLINSLKRCKACFVGAVPGLTKSLQEIQLDKHIRLIDSPGVVMATSGLSDTQLILKNCTRLEQVDDPIPAVSNILSRCQRDKLMMFYTLPLFETVEQFLALLAKRMGKLKKGGIPNVAAAGRKVLKDWVDGNISYYTVPPSDLRSEDHYRTSDHLMLVQKWSKEFSLDQFDASSMDECLDRESKLIDHVIETDGPVKMKTNDNDEESDGGVEDDIEMEGGSSDEDVEEDDESDDEDVDMVVEPEHQVTSNNKSAKSSKHQTASPKITTSKDMKRAFKVHQKKNKRAGKLAQELGDEFEDKMETVFDALNDAEDNINDEKYDFNKYFPKSK